MRTSVWVAVACPTTGRVILAKRSQATRNAGQWNFFGGGLDRGERPEKTARRELREEAGLIVDAGHLVPLAEAVSAGKRNLLYGLAVATELKPQLNDESEEYRWLRIEEIKAHHLLHLPTRQLAPMVETWMDALTSPDAAEAWHVAGSDRAKAKNKPPSRPRVLAAWQVLRRLFDETPPTDFL